MSLRDWRLAVALYAPGAAVALVATAPALLGLGAVAALRPLTDRLAAGDYLAALVEVGTAAAGAQRLGSDAPPGLRAGLLGAFAAAALASLGIVLEALAYAFLAGGILERLAGGGRAVFWAGCRRWFWPMLRLSLLAYPAVLLAGGAAGLLLLMLPGTGPLALVARAVALAAWLSVVNGIFELGRAEWVLHGPGGALRALGQALARLVGGRVFLSAGLQWLALAVLGLVHGVGAVALPAALPALGAIVVQQALALVGAWLKVLRLMIAVAIAERPPARAGAAAER